MRAWGAFVPRAPGVVFVCSPRFADGESRDWAPRVRVDDGQLQRVPFGTSFIEMEPGRRHVRIESGQPRLWAHRGVDVIVDVPADGRITLFVKCGYFGHQRPTVTPGPDSVAMVWLKAK
jgi:hypothetical protein